MGIVREEITLSNAMDEGKVLDGLLKQNQVRSMKVEAVVDTGTITLVINEKCCGQLGLRTVGQRNATLANGQKQICKVTEPVHIQWKNRDCRTSAYVAPNANNILLGAIPLEDMDLMVDPVRQQLAGVHGEEIVSYLL